MDAQSVIRYFFFFAKKKPLNNNPVYRRKEKRIEKNVCEHKKKTSSRPPFFVSLKRDKILNRGVIFLGLKNGNSSVFLTEKKEGKYMLCNPLTKML